MQLILQALVIRLRARFYTHIYEEVLCSSAVMRDVQRVQKSCKSAVRKCRANVGRAFVRKSVQFLVNESRSIATLLFYLVGLVHLLFTYAYLLFVFLCVSAVLGVSRRSSVEYMFVVSGVCHIARFCINPKFLHHSIRARPRRRPRRDIRGTRLCSQCSEPILAYSSLVSYRNSYISTCVTVAKFVDSTPSSMFYLQPCAMRMIFCCHKTHSRCNQARRAREAAGAAREPRDRLQLRYRSRFVPCAST